MCAGHHPELTGRDLFASPLERVDTHTSERTLLMSSSWEDGCVRIVRDVALKVIRFGMHTAEFDRQVPDGQCVGRSHRMRSVLR